MTILCNTSKITLERITGIVFDVTGSLLVTLTARMPEGKLYKCLHGNDGLGIGQFAFLWTFRGVSVYCFKEEKSQQVALAFKCAKS